MEKEPKTWLNHNRLAKERPIMSNDDVELILENYLKKVRADEQELALNLAMFDTLSRGSMPCMRRGLELLVESTKTDASRMETALDLHKQGHPLSVVISTGTGPLN